MSADSARPRRASIQRSMLGVERRHKWAYYTVSAAGTRKLSAWLA